MTDKKREPPPEPISRETWLRRAVTDKKQQEDQFKDQLKKQTDEIVTEIQCRVAAACDEGFTDIAYEAPTHILDEAIEEAASIFNSDPFNYYVKCGQIEVEDCGSDGKPVIVQVRGIHISCLPPSPRREDDH